MIYYKCHQVGGNDTKGKDMKNYYLAFVDGGTGRFDIVEKFVAENDNEARQSAESIALESFSEFGPWYVLDSQKKNIDA